MAIWVGSDHLLHSDDGRVIHSLIPEASTQPNIHPWSLILHSQSGPALTRWERLRDWMARADVHIESHLISNMDGMIVQTVPFNVRADCNYKANSWKVPYGNTSVAVGAISIETQDNGYPTLDKTPWTPAQFDTLADVTAAIGHKYGIPYQPPARWDDTGVGYHSQFAEWSAYKGKTCPGAARIYQMDELRHRAANKCVCIPAERGS